MSSANLGFTLIGAQALAQVPLNGNSLMLDGMVMLMVINRTTTAPPGSPSSGDRYLVATGGTGAWSGKDGLVAYWNSGWTFFTPKEGWLMWVSAEARLLVFHSSAWADASNYKTPPATLTDAATIATDASKGSYFRTLLTSAVGSTRILGAPTNLTDNQEIIWEFKQSSSGGNALTLNAIFEFGTDITSATLSTGANKVDLIKARYNAAAAKLWITDVKRGF